jgi:nucleotide-binding universal stress UspA family protein
LRAVAAVMEDAKVSCVLVGTGTAIVTEHDVADALASGLTAESPVGPVSTRTPVWATTSSTLVDAVGMMVARGVRHLLVLSPDGSVVGVLGLTEATRVLLDQAVGHPGPRTLGDSARARSPRGAAPPALATIAVGFDGSPDSEAALRWAVGVARQTRARIAVVHAVGLLEHARADPAAIDGLASRVRRIAQEAGLPEELVPFEVQDGDPCTVLCRAEQPPLKADLVVVGSRGKGAHRGAMLGSTSHQLAERITVPLVIVPRSAIEGATG